MKVYTQEKLNLLVDGTYFSNNLCLILYRDAQIKFTQLYRFSDGEHYEEIKEDLKNILSLGVKIESITCDGHKALLKAIKQVCRESILQRCIVHIQRECRLYLSSSPKTQAGVTLLQIVNHLHLIQTHEQSHYWIKALILWYRENETYINEKSFNTETQRFWYTHKLVRRAFIQMKNALPDMFQYLFNSHIPKSTNGLESFFGHLKSHVLMHRGLTPQHRKHFMQWYLYFRNQ